MLTVMADKERRTNKAEHMVSTKWRKVSSPFCWPARKPCLNHYVNATKISNLFCMLRM